MYFLYSVLLAAWLVLTLPYWLLQMLRHGKYRAGLSQRLGKVSQGLTFGEGASKPVIWVHAVSVGEVQAVSGLITELRRRHSHYRLVVSTTTATGQKLAQTRFGESNVFYFPFDFAFAIRPYLRALAPKIVVIAETEFWPNFLRWGKRSGAAIAIVNARISDRSLPGYRRVRKWLAPVLANVDLFLAQTNEDRTRLVSIGARSDRIAVTGNLKFDVEAPLPPPVVSSLRSTFDQSGAVPVIVCGSTVDDEEPLLLRAFENVLASHPRAVMILAPRHPERFAQVAALLENMDIRFLRRSLWNGEPVTGGVFLVDSIGELASLYSLADIAFVGGSLVPRGGHNIIEPARYGVPIVVGNHTDNFRDIVELFQNNQAVRVVGPAELPLVWMELIGNKVEREALGRRAAETMRSQAGATARTAEALERFLEPVSAYPVSSRQ